MSKNIAISDKVYRRLRREKGDRSFSEVIQDRLEAGSRLTDVTGRRVLDGDVHESVKRDIEQVSEGALDRVDDEAP